MYAGITKEKMDNKGSNTLIWIVLSLVVVVFSGFVMQLRGNIAKSNDTLKNIETQYLKEIRDLKTKLEYDYKMKLDKLDDSFNSEIPSLKKKIEGSSTGKLSQKLDKAIETSNAAIEKMKKQQDTDYNELNNAIKGSKETIDILQNNVLAAPVPYGDCEAALNAGYLKNGIFRVVDPTGQEEKGIEVYCDQTYNYGGGGWIVFQRRKDYGVTMDRSWRDYKEGFGDLTGDFWLGNKYIEAWTSKNLYEVRVDLWDNKGDHKHATYADFKVGPEGENYVLTLGEYRGTAGDSFSVHNNVAFSTYDRDNDRFGDGNCADLWKSGWWFTDCYLASLNGQPGFPGWNGVKWEKFHWKDDPAITKTEIKIRRTKVST